MSINKHVVLIVILISFVLRLIAIRDAPLEISHNWRQSFTAMVARNFDKAEFLHPEVDMDGGRTVAMEFPVFSYLIHIFNTVFGYAHWYGRLINLIVSSVGLFYFFRFVRLLYTERLALFSTVVLTCSIYFAFSRKMMPDTFSISLVLIGVYYLANYVISIRHSLLELITGSIFICIGLLSKIPSITILAFLAPVLIDFKFKLKYRSMAVIFGIIPGLLFAYLWYGIMVPMQLQNGAMQLYYPVRLIDGFGLLAGNLSGVFEKFYFSAFFSYILFIFFLIGIILLIIKKEKSLTILFSASIVSFFFFMLVGSNFFYFHNYYIIPIVPAMAVICGFALSNISNRRPIVAILFLCVGLSEAILNQQHGFFIPRSEMYKETLTGIVDKHVPLGMKVLINTGPNPQGLYFCNRKGWMLDEPLMITRKLIKEKTNENLVVIIDRHLKTTFDEMEFSIIFQNEDFELLQLKE